MWYDIEVGKPIRIRNQYGQELDRTILAIDEKTVTYQRHEVEDGKLSVINKKRFEEIYSSMGIPYVEGQYGDRMQAELDPEFDWNWDENGQMIIDLRPIDQKYDV